MKQFYSDLVKALEALPKKRLIRGLMVNREGESCAVGAYVRWMEATGAIPYCSAEHWAIMENDGFDGTPEERYTYMLQWAKAKAR